eukprot:2111109-Rhodomonas_salina.2
MCNITLYQLQCTSKEDPHPSSLARSLAPCQVRAAGETLSSSAPISFVLATAAQLLHRTGAMRIPAMPS